ncbi:hypothetical protein J2Z17_004177 [Rhizobium halophytocola]|uniref:Uncharacterized protein n=1 Tax=Rhizobium halophytocola TaxID=735519 RepID=A0ABS4E438_9HYPH|nr:hypothetical protein [Rhizobium halophytocola]
MVVERDNRRCSGLCHPHFAASDTADFRLGRQTSSKTRSTPRASRLFRFPTTPKQRPGIDRNPFIPAQSRVCRVAEMTMIFSALVSGLTAVALAVIHQIPGLIP